MDEEEATRLAARAGTESRRRRKALHRLVDAAVSGDMVAVRVMAEVCAGWMLDVVWRVLGGSGVEDFRLEAMTAIVRRPDPEVLTAQMRDGVAVALGLDHPVADLARAKVRTTRDPRVVDELCSIALRDHGIATFCVENGLAPADPARRAIYLVVLGRTGEYRALDPDGSLLQRAYAYATNDDRKLIRDAVTRSGDTDLVRLLVAGNHAEIVRLSGPELSGVAQPLLARGDWSALWSLLTDVSILDAASLSRWLEPGWQPESELDQRLLAALRSTDPTQLAKWRDRPTLLGRVHVDGAAQAVAVAPDGGQAAVAWVTHSRMGSIETHIDVFDLPSGARRVHRALGCHLPGVQLAHCGESVLCGSRVRGLVRYSDDGEETVTDEPVLAVASAGGSFAALSASGVLLGSGGTVLHQVPAARLGIAAPWWRACASPDGQRFAFAAGGRLVVVELSARAVTRSDSTDVIGAMTFLGPDEIVTADAGAGRWLRRWRVGSSEPVERAESPVHWTADLVGLPGLSALAVRTNGDPAPLDFVDLDSLHRLSDRTWPAYLRQRGVGVLKQVNGHTIAVAARGGRSADPYADVVETHDLSLGPPMSLLTTPASALRPDDMRVVMSGNRRDPRIRLLRLTLERRLGAELALGSNVAAPRRPDDIALAEET